MRHGLSAMRVPRRRRSSLLFEPKHNDMKLIDAIMGGIKNCFFYFRSKGGGVSANPKKPLSENTQIFFLPILTNLTNFWPNFFIKGDVGVLPNPKILYQNKLRCSKKGEGGPGGMFANCGCARYNGLRMCKAMGCACARQWLVLVQSNGMRMAMVHVNGAIISIGCACARQLSAHICKAISSACARQRVMHHL